MSDVSRRKSGVAPKRGEYAVITPIASADLRGEVTAKSADAIDSRKAFSIYSDANRNLLIQVSGTRNPPVFFVQGSQVTQLHFREILERNLNSFIQAAGSDIKKINALDNILKYFNIVINKTTNYDQLITKTERQLQALVAQGPNGANDAEHYNQIAKLTQSISDLKKNRDILAKSIDKSNFRSIPFTYTKYPAEGKKAINILTSNDVGALLGPASSPDVLNTIGQSVNDIIRLLAETAEAEYYGNHLDIKSEKISLEELCGAVIDSTQGFLPAPSIKFGESDVNVKYVATRNDDGSVSYVEVSHEHKFFPEPPGVPLVGNVAERTSSDPAPNPSVSSLSSSSAPAPSLEED